MSASALQLSTENPTSWLELASEHQVEHFARLAFQARQRGLFELASEAAEEALRFQPQCYNLMQELSISGFYSARAERQHRSNQVNEQLLKSRTVPEDVRQLARSNSQYHAKTLGQRGLGRNYRLNFPVPEGYVLMNTSLARKGQELWGVIRAVNYRYIDGIYTLPPQYPVHSLNYLVQLGPQGQLLERIQLEDPIGGRPEALVKGPEDLRLFIWRDRFFATATIVDHSPNHRCQMGLLEFDQSGKSLGLQLLDEPRPLQNQKNWTPLVDGERVRLLVHAEPTWWAELEPETGQLCFETPTEPPLALADIRGGSAWIPYQRRDRPGWLSVVHDVQLRPDGLRIYLHRLLWANKDGQLIELSPPFRFFDTHIEYCSGLARRSYSRHLPLRRRSV